MKRNVQMKDAGIPALGMRADHFHGFRGIGRPKREWHPGPLLVERPNLLKRMAKAAAEGKATLEEFHAKVEILPVPRKPVGSRVAALLHKLFRFGR